MYVDAELLLDDADIITTDRDSTDVVNLGKARDIGAGEQLYVVLVVDTAAHADDAAKTLTITLSTGSEETLGTTILVTPAIRGDALTAGRVPIVIPIPPGIAEQYIGLEYDVSVDFNATALTVTAFIAKDLQTNL